MALEQEGYRWRNDDGNETGATWLENQDTPATFALDTGKRLRILVNATGDPANAKYRLEYKKSTDSQWQGVPVAGTPGHAITLATSSNISASGDNTTAQLAAPAGKNTSDFDTGRIWDDENGLDEIDVTSDDYTELEWCVQAVTGVAAATDVYQFRVTLEAVAAEADVATSGSGTNFVHAGSYVTSLNLTTYTVAAGDNLALYVGVAWQLAVTGVTVTWNGDGLTLVDEHDDGVGQNVFVKIYRLLAPDAGNHTLALSWTGANQCTVGALALKNVNQTTPEVVADTEKATATGTAIATGAVTCAAGDATFGIAGIEDAAAATAAFSSTDSQTEHWRQSTADEVAGAGSYALGGSSNNHQWTGATSRPWAAIGIHIQKA
jgi:hypothetical protein